jgi:hypothetical protein
VKRPVTRILVIALWAVLVPCCVSVLELDDYDDAIVELCKCDMDVPQLGGECVTMLRSRLDSVSEDARREWLRFYASECQGTCENAFACFQNVGTCAVVSCSEDRECCDYAEESGMRCIAELCEPCRAEGASCSRDGECCGEDARCEDTCVIGGSSSVNVSSVSAGGATGAGGAMQ